MLQAPKTPVDALARIPPQLLPWRGSQMKPNSVSISSSDRPELATHVRVEIMQEQLAVFGEGGSFVTASHEESIVGQACGELVGE